MNKTPEGKVQFKDLKIGDRFYTAYGTSHQRTFEKLEYDGLSNARAVANGGVAYIPDTMMVMKADGNDEPTYHPIRMDGI